MKSSKLFLTSLLAAAAMSATAYAETDLSGFSGTIYTWAGRNGVNNKSDLAYGYYYTTDESGAFTAITYGNSTSGDANNWKTTVQPIIGRDNASATAGPTYQNTLRFVALDDSSFTGDYTAGTIKTPVYTFNPLTLGGIIVESGATGFSISANGTSTRSFMLGNGDGTAAKSVFHESFTLTLNTGDSNTTNTIRGTQTWTIDENKTFTITSGSRALNFTGATTINGGGTAKLSGSNVSFGAGASIDIAANTTLDLSGATFTGNGATFELNGGNIVLGDVSRLGDTALLSASTITATSGSVELSGVIKNGTYTIFTGTDSATLGTLSLTAANSGYYDQAWSIDGSTISVTISNSVRDLIWSGATNTPWDTASANWKTSAEATESTTFKNYDSVTFDASTTGTETNIATGVTVTDLTISGGTHRFTVSSEAYVKIAGTASVENGATLVLDTKTGGKGLLRGAITVKSGGELQFTKGDLTGYNGGEDSLRSITIDAGGRLYLNHSTNETFAGTLTLNGTLSGKDANTRWDMYGGSSQIVVGEGANASIDENVKLVIRRDNAPITVGADATLTINGQVLKSSVFSNLSGGNDVLVKNGAGKLTLNGNVNVTGVTQNAGTLTIGGAAAITTLTQSAGTLTIGGAATITTLTQSAGTLNVTAGTTTVGTYGGLRGQSVAGALTIAAGASMSVTGGMTLRWENENTTTLNVNGDLSVGGNLWISRDGNGIVNINDGGTVVAQTLTFGQGWNTTNPTKKSSTVNLGSGGVLVVGAVVANTTAGASGATTSLNTSALNLNGGTLGTSADSLTINVTSGSGSTAKTLSVVLGDGTTSTINTGKYDTATKTFTEAKASISIVNAISGSGALKKVGAGTLTLSGANSFTGGLEIKEGIVVSTRTYSLGAGTNVVKLSGGQLSVNADVTLAQTNIEIALSSAYATTAAIIGAAATASLAVNTTVTITDLDLTGIALVSEAALANSSYEFKILDTISAGENLTFKLSEALRNDWRISGYKNGVLTIAAIPEPSVFGLLAGLGALALAGARRRRKKA